TDVSWVMVKTKTRTKKSSRVETRPAGTACPGRRVPSHPAPGRGPAREGVLAGLGLVGVGPGESSKRLVGAVALAQVAGQDGGPGGAGVALGQQGAADPGEVHQGRPVHALD